MRWGDRIRPGRRSSDFVSFVDLAPTFLAAAGIEKPRSMTGNSLLKVLEAEGSGRADASRDFVITGRERHTPAQAAPSMAGYPSRAIRTDRWLYIRNLAPDRWPAGVPENSTRGPGYADCDNGPTKTYILEHRDRPEVRRSYEWCFARRPAEELYDCRKDPFQLTNLADRADLDTVKKELGERLDAFLERTGDPRVTGKPVRFDEYPYYGRMDRSARK
jgi:arylsulfatase A-like enzyme